ncbi:acyl-CoA thioesterase [Rhodopseudomonas palustris]|uniref:Acyl-CoA thioesterase n=2 Tax=Rhodopseudomonas palustris TaxID=1076 RepID=A0A418VKP9_RHOPL|nr:acyl-CoA thioesterase [Rhodopseudomonas palustris]
MSDNVRFADLDPNNHVNNAVYASYFETSRVTLMKDPARGLIPPGQAWVLVRLDIHFRSELHWPGTIELGIGLVKLGRTSAHFDQVVFSDGVCIASARAVNVLVDAVSRKPAPLSEQLTADLSRWWRRGFAEEAPTSS